jgi:hypothetical protein
MKQVGSRPWRWRRHVPPKRRLSFNELRRLNSNQHSDIIGQRRYHRRYVVSHTDSVAKESLYKYNRFPNVATNPRAAFFPFPVCRSLHSGISAYTYQPLPLVAQSRVLRCLETDIMKGPSYLPRNYRRLQFSLTLCMSVNKRRQLAPDAETPSDIRRIMQDTSTTPAISIRNKY